ncbi:MAG: hypothetical protein H2184_01125 [Candidatus Galacturonibacter soehngenii]|nr:hypothetical protein [Candidatus Galacturonibacter soehngenii]
MFRNKKMIMIYLLSILVTGVICSIIVYSLTLQSMQIKKGDLYGTYQFNIRDLDNTEYLAVILPSAGDANEQEGEFQWYNINNEVLAQGTCKIDKGGFVTFEVDGNSIATIFGVDEKYYFVDDSIIPQEIIKISEEPMVSTP